MTYPSEELFPSDDVFPSDPPPGLVRPPELLPALGGGRLTDHGYQLLVAETVTGRVVAELPHTDLSWDTPLNGIGKLSATVPIDESITGLGEWDDRDPRAILRSVLRSEWKFTIALTYDRRPVWAGPLVTSQPVTGDWSVRLGAVELPALLDRRRLITPGYELTPAAAGADTITPQTTLANIALLLFEQAIAPGGPYSLPLILPGDISTVGDHRMHYLASDLASYWERISQLIALDGGPDIRCDPVITYGGGDGGDTLAWRVRIGQPHLGSAEPWVWDDQVNQRGVTVDRDASDMILRAYIPGQTFWGGVDRDAVTVEDDQKPLGVAQDPDLLALGFPILDAKLSDYADQFAVRALDLFAAGAVRAHSRPAEVWKVDVAADSFPRLGEWQVGDPGLFDIRDQLMIDDGVYARRIIAAAGGQDLVTLTLAPTPGQVV